MKSLVTFSRLAATLAVEQVVHTEHFETLTPGQKFQDAVFSAAIATDKMQL
jgi:hypothetical protein